MLATESVHTIQLPRFSNPTPEEASVSAASSISPKEVAAKWLSSFASVLAGGDVSKLSTVLHADSWWRDQLAMSWDLRTLHGIPKLSEFLTRSLPQAQPYNFRLTESGKFAPGEKTPVEGLDWIESMFTFETKVGRGKGILRIVQGKDGAWKGYMVYTALQELKGYEDLAGARRPHGGKNSLEGGVIKGNWYERRQRQIEFLDGEPDVICVGAGQSGLNLGARLQALGLSCLLIDKNERVGDNWRNRYRTLVTHDPVQYTHMAYMPFPSNWPLFTPKDKLADWFGAYASLMELNVWMRSTITSASYDDANSTWTATIKRCDGTTRTLKSHHLVFCTGHSGEPKVPSFPGQADFAGTVYHGSQHRDASLSGAGELNGKKVVVVGTGNSGHDIAQNYAEHGASVTMVQRRGTYVISASKGLFMMHEGLYDEWGPPTEDADIYGQSLPMPVQFALNVGSTARIAEAEKENIEGLKKAGFEVDFGSDGSGIYRKYVTRGGGYYIDVGASQLIIEGKIKVVQSPDGLKGFDKDALVLADGRRLESDIVVLATGYDNMKTSVEKALGRKVASRCRDVWDLDEEGEINAMWRPSGHPGLWFMGGSLALCRIYSRFLALQIRAVEAGLVTR
ncbi:putative flavin-containing monooxygenase YUCCA3 [Saccharata proteae CBS 121410]|uniref:Flavin-containing monooxygenase YUCCA3 n=1 Tax=Saccharata proteae CBS 121410 TaxID=1314787 RepID=A0A9P4LTT2_9PEZI|nr:putative flavin-containing monooxygenase YUCCA3 [Saccharata proteae CBS 121410]